MKKLSRSLTARSVFFMLAVCLSSCKQDVSVQPNPSVSQVQNDKIELLDLQGVKIEDGLLCFESLESMRKIREKLDKSNFASYKAWCIEKGFESMSLIKDKLLTEYGTVDTDSKLLTFNEKNKNILIFNNDGSIEFKNTAIDMFRFLNKNSMMKIGKSLYLFDEKGEIIVHDGDLSKMLHVISDRKQEAGVLVYPIDQVQIRSGCTENNYSGLTTSASDPARRANVRTCLFWRVFTRDNNITIDAEALWSIEANAQKRLFRIWYNYSTSQTVDYDVMMEVIRPVPTFMRGPNIVDRQNAIVTEDNHTMIISKVVATFSGIPTQQFDSTVRPFFNFIDINYSNRGGVSIEYHCN